MKMPKNVFLSSSTAVILLAVISSTQGNRCGGRGSSREGREAWQAMVDAGECRPVSVPIPVVVEGYEVITPNAVMVNRCHHFQGCNMRQCLPSKITEKIVKVKGWKSGMSKARCMEFKTVEHEKCECGCKADMCNNEVQDYDARMCKCTCKKKIQQECNALINALPNKIMFNPTTCKCLCNKTLICGSGEMFDKNMCKCVSTNQMMGNEISQTKQ